MSEEKMIKHAYWVSPNRCLLFLKKDWVKKETLPLSLQSSVGDQSVTVERAPLELVGSLTGFYSEADNYSFVLEADEQGMSESNESIYLVGDFNEWGESIGDKKWELEKQEVDGRSVYQLKKPIASISEEEAVCFKFVTESERWLTVPDDAPNCVSEEVGINNFQLNPSQTGKHVFVVSIEDRHEVGKEYSLSWNDETHNETHPIANGPLLCELETKLKLGAIVDGNETCFRLFAPRAKSVRVEFSKQIDKSDLKTLDLVLADETTWEVRHSENLHSYYYSFFVSGHNRDAQTLFDETVPLLDPYALACLNADGPGIIWDEALLPKPKTQFEAPAVHDLVIMEGHIRDLIKQAPVKLTDYERQGFSGLTKWLNSSESYLKEIGVNALELQPCQQFDSMNKEEYHWGYMTTNYFSPCCHYALAPEKGSQIEEFAQLIEAAHDQNLAIIIDVVYNHVGVPEHLMHVDKEYYFELDGEGGLMNWSGCGNTMRCDTPMARKLIIESLAHFIEVYDVDGFRFDLAELMGIEVLREIEVELKKIKPSIILIAEPWSFRGHIADALKATDYSSWNDHYREFIVDYVQGKGNQDGIKYFVSGSIDPLSRFPAQTINYVESHDDRCWLDKITENADFDGSKPTENDRVRTHLMFATLFSSVGVPMISAGQDMMRSKDGNNNTYQRGDINALNYGRINEFKNTHEYVKAWVEFRLSTGGKLLRQEHKPSNEFFNYYAQEGFSSLAVLFNADNSQGDSQLLFVINPHDEAVSIALSDLDFSQWFQLCDREHFLGGSGKSDWLNQQDRTLGIPAQNCGLFQRIS